MKKCICFALLIGIIILSGCSLPASQNSNDVVDKVKEPLPDNKKEDSTKNETLNGNNVHNTTKGEKADEIKNPAGKGTLPVTLYYQDGEGFIVPVTIGFERQEGIARAAVESLVDNSLTREELEYYGIFPVLPQGTEILGINIKQGTAVIDFNNKLLNYEDGTAERNIISAVVYTLTEFKTVDSVRILVNGRSPGRLKFGTEISGTLGRENVLVNSERLNLKEGMRKIDIYLTKVINDKRICILPLSIEFSGPEGDDVPARIVELLVMEHSGGKLHSELPSGTKLLQSDHSANTLILDFNGEIKKYGGTAREDGIIKQILYSMKQIKGVERVRILIEGKPDYLPEGTDLTNEMAIPREINLIEELR